MAALAERPPLRDSPTEEEARAIIRRHQDSAPVKVSAIARDLGLLVYSAPLESGISGKIFRDDQGGTRSGYVIYVNEQEPERRQRFTAAHEIAHYILHRSLIGDGLSDDALYRSKLSSPMEAQANALAADILMPWQLVNALTAEGVTDLEALADRLEVSETAIAVRLGIPT